MVKVEVAGVFPASRDEVWALLQRHRDDIPAIHPAIQTQRILKEEGEVTLHDATVPERVVLERTWRLGRRLWTSRWQYTQAPPDRFRVELVGGDEPLTVGSHWENRYEETPRGTLVSTKAEITFQDLKVPRGLHAWAVRRTMRQSDREDLAYLRRAGPRAVGPSPRG